MKTRNDSAAFDFGTQIRRSQGRSGRTLVASAKVTAEELRELETASKASGKALSEWSRDVLLREARRPKHDPILTEVIAGRLLMGSLFRLLTDGQILSVEAIKQAMKDSNRDKFKAAEIVTQQYAQSSAPEGTDGK